MRACEPANVAFAVADSGRRASLHATLGLGTLERKGAVVVSEEGKDATLRDYVRVVARRKWLVFGVAAAVTALVLAYAFVQTPMYKASALLIYESPLNVADPLSTGSYVDPTQMQVELNSIAGAIANPEVSGSARTALGSGIPPSTYTVTAAPTSQSSQSTTGTASITAVSPGAETAARAANAYATAFVASRKAIEQQQVRAAEEVVQTKLASYTTTQERASADYQTQFQRLQDLQILENTVTGDFRVLTPATVPSQPFSPRPKRDGAMGLLGGLILGVAIVLLLDQFDTRVRTVTEATAILGMPVLGTVRKMSARVLDEQPLFAVGGSHSPAAEGIRKLRASLEFANVDGDLGSLFITSSVQHEGKTLTVCNLAVSIAASGRRVLLVDGDLRRPQVHRYLGLRNTAGLSTALTGKGDWRQAAHSYSDSARIPRVRTIDGSSISSDGDSRLHVLTSGPVPPNPAEIIASKSFASLMAEVHAEFDMVIVDAPALLAVGDTAAIANCVDGLVFLVDLTDGAPPTPCRSGGADLADALSQAGPGDDRSASQAPGGPSALLLLCTRGPDARRRPPDQRDHGPQVVSDESGLGRGRLRLRLAEATISRGRDSAVRPLSGGRSACTQRGRAASPE